jgi:hypothetical protein
MLGHSEMVTERLKGLKMPLLSTAFSLPPSCRRGRGASLPSRVTRPGDQDRAPPRGGTAGKGRRHRTVAPKTGRKIKAL